MSKINNLIVVAHPDDEILGCGGTGARLVAQGEKVTALIMCSNAEARELHPGTDDLRHDTLMANDVLGFQHPILVEFPNLRLDQVPQVELVRTIEDAIRKIKPARVFTHSSCDLNIDHQIVARACLVASKLPHRETWGPNIPALYFMEILSSTEWSNDPVKRDVFNPTSFFDITDYIDLKIKALSKYRNVMRPSPHSRSERVIKSLAAYRGAQCVSEYAEGFVVGFVKA